MKQLNWGFSALISAYLYNCWNRLFDPRNWLYRPLLLSGNVFFNNPKIEWEGFQ